MKNQARLEQSRPERKKPARQSQPRPDGLLDWLFNWLDASLIQQTAGEVARECHGAIWEGLHDELSLMTPAKAREFVRDFAAEAICAEVEPIMQRRRIRAALRGQIVAEAIDQVVEIVVKELARSRLPRRARRAA